MSEYEPGTIAVATLRDEANVRVVRGDGHWCRAADTDDFITDSRNEREGLVTDVRPLVVLDLSDYSWLPNRLRLHGDEIGMETGRRLHDLADQIEQQTRPPRPAEPTAGGAQVREADGTVWTRVEGQPNKPWVYGGTDARYDALDVVEVLP